MIYDLDTDVCHSGDNDPMVSGPEGTSINSESQFAQPGINRGALDGIIIIIIMIVSIRGYYYECQIRANHDLDDS